MRVITGTAGGLNLETPPGTLRPTMDKTKAALFSSLGDLVKGVTVLDIFAGSGSLGIEALSRGATHCTFVENDPAAVETIRKNLRKTKLLASATLLRSDADLYLRRLAPDAPPFGLILADPPYAHPGQPEAEDWIVRLLAWPRWPALLAPGGILVLEQPTGHLRTESPLLRHLRTLRHGAATLTTFTHTATEAEETGTD